MNVQAQHFDGYIEYGRSALLGCDPLPAGQGRSACLFPELRRAGRPDIEQIVARVSRLESEHRIAAAWHHQVHDIGERWLRQDYLLPPEVAELLGVLTSLTELYRGHIAVEENEIFPVAEEELSAFEKEAIGRRMALRRGARFIVGSPTIEHAE